MGVLVSLKRGLPLMLALSLGVFVAVATLPVEIQGQPHPK